MRKDFLSLDELLECVKNDKEASGAAAGTANRYPIRFVLFDNFQDSYQFVSEVQDNGCVFKNVNDWLDSDSPDTILTYSELSNSIIEYIQTNDNDCIITPFSELARFYNNENNHKEFDVLVRTIKGIENSNKCVANNRRVYIPIVGLEGKMSLFENDTQSTIWYLKNSDKRVSYNLIVTDGTLFGVNDLSNYQVTNNVHEWLEVWKERPAVKPIIICTSAAIFANAQYAQPDNAFNFVICNNTYDFLTKGLHLNFGEIVYKQTDENYWKRLASEISEIKTFSLEKFFNSYFHIDDLADYNVFLKTWFECKDEFEKWLLTTYYNDKFCKKGYICHIINKIQSYTNNDFFSTVLLEIFTLENSNSYIEERLICLQVAPKHNILLSQDIENAIREKLCKMAEDVGYATAIKYFSPLTRTEKLLSIEWLASGFITKESVQTFYPDLYYYLGSGIVSEQQWIDSYFDDYRNAKLINKYTEQISKQINKRNASNLTFNSWYQTLKTTKTILNGRSDIEAYYWIDGLGIEWIPYIKNLIERKQSESVYLNEIYVARAIYPTTTEINKQTLLDLSENKLNKCGDLDLHAHQNTNKYPLYILEEFEIINKAMEIILSEYNGKKIAIVSDHGLTALSQLCSGLNMAGVESDHHGRLAVRNIGNGSSNTDYIICDDEKTICALKHQSLCGKVPAGQSAHGGCSPEEILVPIFVISSNKETKQWTAVLQTKNITETNPIVKYEIKGISAADTFYINYNENRYELHSLGNDIFESEKLKLDSSITSVMLVINNQRQTDNIEVKVSAIEDDLLNFNM